MAATMAGGGLPLNGGAQATMRFTPATFAVTIDICAEASSGIARRARNSQSLFTGICLA